MENVFTRVSLSFLSKIKRVAMVASLSAVAFLPSLAQHEGFVDMGIKADDGKNLLWAQGDLLMTDDNRFFLLGSDQIGETFGWGDITGRAVGSDLRQYGGVNPPTKISGNPKYDICTAKLGADYRLPTSDEIMELWKNSTFSVHEGERKLPQYDSRGVPTWIYGQWMWQGGGSWHSLQFDGPLVSVISSTNGNMRTTYYGAYSYKDGTIVIPNLIRLTLKDKSLVAENGGYFMQISQQTKEGTILYGVLTSKINGNELRFTFSIGSPVISTGKYVIDMSNDRSLKSIGYWTGSLMTDEGRQGGVFFRMRENDRFSAELDVRNAHYRIRPVKEYIDTISARLEREKREREMRDSLRRIEEAREKIRQDSIRRVESIKSTPLLNVFWETADALGNERFFNAIYASHSGDTTSYYICATDITQKLHKEFWKKVTSSCDKSSCWERKQVWEESPDNRNRDSRISIKSKETNAAARRSDFSLRCFSMSYRYIGKTDSHNYGDYKEILDCDDTGKLWYAAWALLSDERGYVADGFNPDRGLRDYVVDMFNNQVESNIRSIVGKYEKGYRRMKISPVLEVPKSTYRLKAIPVDMGDFACIMRLGGKDICVPFLTIDKCKPGTPLYKVDVIK